MQEKLVTRDVVCRHLSVSRQVLVRYEELGLVRPVKRDGEVRYGKEAIRQAWGVVSLHRDLRINLAGVEAIMHLRAQLEKAQKQVRALLELVETQMSERSPSRKEGS